MKEYIERDALIAKIDEELSFVDGQDPEKRPVLYGCELGLRGARSFASTLPAAYVVEVVRCKDCKHQRRIQNATDKANVCALGWGLKGIITEEDFCSYGERRSDP